MSGVRSVPEPAPVALDRPASPHDWWYVVRTFGKALMATGLLLGGFVAYQLWGTGIEALRAQNQLEDEFEALLAETTTTVASPTTMSTSSTIVGVTPSPTVPPNTVAETTPDTAPAETVPIIEGDPIARLEIPAIGVDVFVVEGVSVDDLRRGPGHYPDTPLPGQYGNAAIAGHRTTYGQPFYDVDDLEPGDEIVVTTIAGRFVYAVTGTEIVDPGDTDVVATTDSETAQLTLTSCHPKWSARQRIIVHSALVADKSAPVDGPTTTTSTTPTTPSTASTATTATPSTSTASTSPIATDTNPPTTIAGPSAAPTFSTPSGDAFSDGWFHDRSAIPQVALWALVVSAIAVAVHLLRRRVHSRLVGIGVGALPFLIALYFFYQNVNRLLPPSL